MKNQLIYSLCLLVFIVSAYNSEAQKPEIKGDSVFATNQFPIQIKFPSNNIEAVFTDPNALGSYKVDKVGASVNIQGKIDSGKNYALVVNEGKRSHTFIICFKKDLDANNIDNAIHDYSTVKLLQ